MTNLKEIAEKFKNAKPNEIELIDFQVNPKEVFTTVGVYSSGDMKSNGVVGENLLNHIKYNLIMRFGRALFVNGICFNKGYLSEDECLAAAAKIKDVKIEKDTAPYF